VACSRGAAGARDRRGPRFLISKKTFAFHRRDCRARPVRRY
jgi:hypothetical protein